MRSKTVRISGVANSKYCETGFWSFWAGLAIDENPSAGY